MKKYRNKSLAKKIIRKKNATKSKNTHLVMSDAYPIGKITNG